MAKWLPSLTAESADVVSPIDTIIMGGLAERCVDERARKPAGPAGPLAFTTASPLARQPIAFQKVFASISLSMPDAPLPSAFMPANAIPRKSDRETLSLPGLRPTSARSPAAASPVLADRRHRA